MRPRHLSIGSNRTMVLISKVFVIVFGIACFVCGCVPIPTISGSGSEMKTYRNILKEALLEDWSTRKNAVLAAHPGWESIPQPDSFRASQCYRSEQFERYTIDKPFPSGQPVWGIVTTAWYCPHEQRYWIEQSGGDIAYAIRWYGPFSLEMAVVK